jgi:endonuclease YncB( thermonuclease family)
MKKKTITTIVSLATAVVVLIGGYISKNNGNEMPLDVTGQGSVSQTSVTDNSTNNSAGAKNNSSKSADNQNSSKQRADTQSNSTQNTKKLGKPIFPESIVKTLEKGIAPFGYISANVTKVTDGDTFHIKYANQDYKVRMLDIDTPESVKAGVEPQPYAVKASDFTKETLTGKKVKLIFEKGTKDQFDRLLAHVILEDGTYYNALMVQNGYAISVFYSPNTLLKDYFFELQSKAIDTRAGFWQLPESERPFRVDSKGKLVAAYKLKAKAA